MITKNLLRYLLQNYPEYDWDLFKIGLNPNTPISFIKKNKKILMELYSFFNILLNISKNINIKFIKIFEKHITDEQWKCCLSTNKHITLKIVQDFPDKPWDYCALLQNIDTITYDMLHFFEEKISNKIKFYESLLCFDNNMRKISLNIFEKYIHDIDFQRHLARIHIYRNIPFELFKKYPNKQWNWENISYGTIFTKEIFEYFSNKPLNWNIISYYSKIPLDIIEKNLNKPWNWYLLSENTPLSLDIIEKIHLSENLSWKYISKLSYITLDFFEKYYRFDDGNNRLDINNLSQNINLSLEVVEKYNYLDWNWTFLSCNPIITLEFIEKHMDFMWDWNEITKNSNITFEFIEKHIDEDIDWYEISKNPNITLEFIERNIDKIDFNGLSGNEFIYHNKLVKKHARIQLFYYLKYKISNDLNRHITSY